jgi:DNA-binding response OmpR family regulator
MELLSLKSKEPQRRNAARARRKPLRSRELPPRLIVGSLCLNCRTFDLVVDGRTILLTPAEFELLYYLMSRAGQVFSAEQLLRQVWGYPPGTGRTELIRAHIKNLRSKIEQNPKEPVCLRTVGHMGYTIGERESPAA